MVSGDSALWQRLQQVADPHSELEAWIADEDRRWLVRWAAAQVRGQATETTWQAFWQTAVMGRDPREVAGQLRISVGAVYIARSRMLQRLREQLSSWEEL
jgi:RNA polymerase sigma-70 factor (ECF subfamily)